MRLAAIVSSNYGQSTSLASYPGGVESANAIFQRLARDDTGFAAEWMQAERELPEALERWFEERGVADNLLFHFSGYLAWREKLGVGLALDGERGRALSLVQLCRLLDRFTNQYLISLDVVLVSARYPRDQVVAAFDDALGAHCERGSGILVAQPPDTTGEESAFSRLAVWGLDTVREAQPAKLSDWYSCVQPELKKLEPSHAFSFVAGNTDFTLLPAQGPVWSVPPPPPAPVASTIAEQLTMLDQQASDQESREDWVGLARTLEAILDRSSGSAAHQVALKLASVTWSKLGSAEGAVEVLSRVITADGGSAQTCLALSDLYASTSQYDVAIDQCVAGIDLAPSLTAGYRRAHRLFEVIGVTDRAWNAASALAVLDAATPEQLALADQHRPLGLQMAQATLTEDHWQGLAIRPQRHRTLERIVSLVADAAIAHRLKVLRRAKLIPPLDPNNKQDPQTSTTTIGRSLAWTARLNNVECPELFLRDSEEATIGPVPSANPVCLVSKAFARGFSLPELTFLWGRTLTYFRPEHYPLVFFDSVDEMASLLMAAALAADWTPDKARSFEPDTARLAGQLKKSVSAEHLQEIREATERLTLDKARTRVSRWVNAIDEAANRAGLIACGDVRVAIEMISRFPIRGPESVSDHTVDVLRYSVGADYAVIRQHLGVALPSVE